MSHPQWLKTKIIFYFHFSYWEISFIWFVNKVGILLFASDLWISGDCINKQVLLKDSVDTSILLISL